MKTVSVGLLSAQSSHVSGAQRKHSLAVRGSGSTNCRFRRTASDGKQQRKEGRPRSSEGGMAIRRRDEIATSFARRFFAGLVLAEDARPSPEVVAVVKQAGRDDGIHCT